MTGFNPNTARRLGLLLLGLFAVRWIVHFAMFRDGVAIAEIAGMDVAAFVLMFLASAFGPNVGRHVGSIMLFVVVVGLALAGFGYLAQLRSRHLSQMMAFVGVMGIGTGLCLATTTWNQARWIMGLLAVGGGTYGLTQIQQKLDALVIASPYVLASVALVLLGARRSG